MNTAASPSDSTDPAATSALTPSQRHDGWTPQRQRAFCEELAECGSVERAAAAVGMSRETAYRLRRKASGRAFALAWDAALLLARQRLIDEVFEMAFEGSIERHFRDGQLVVEKRRRDPRGLLNTIERIGSAKALGSGAASAVANDFEAFLDCMDEDAAHHEGAAAAFIGSRMENASLKDQQSLTETHWQLVKLKYADQSRQQPAAGGRANVDSA